MKRVLTGIGALALAVVGTGVLTAGSAGAVVPRQAASPNVTVEFTVRGDLALIDGRLHDFNCVDKVQPNPFRLYPPDRLPVEVQSFVSPLRPCTSNEAIWLLTTQPKSPKDAPETMGVRLRYGSRPTTVEFLHVSKDLRWNAHILSPTRVVVEITGK